MPRGHTDRTHRTPARSLLGLAAAAGLAIQALTGGAALAQDTREITSPAATTTAATTTAPVTLVRGSSNLTPAGWADALWQAARLNDEAQVESLVASPPEAALTQDPDFSTIITKFVENQQKRAEGRQTEFEEASAKLDEHLAKANEAEGVLARDVALGKALSSAVSMQMLVDHDGSVLADPRVSALIDRTRKAAAEAEARGEWLVSNELYFRLDTLLETERTYADDVDRLSRRLSMIRLYNPERLWELRNERRLAEEEEPYPPYNPIGDDYRTKLSGIDATMIYRALQRAALQHVGRVSLEDMIIGGLDAVETMATTSDLYDTFDGLADPAKRSEFISVVQQLRAAVERSGVPARAKDLRVVLERLIETNQDTVGILQSALMHEFGNGAMSMLDDYTAIIWPDELARFQRSTQGEFIGVGVQIQLDELFNIEIVTPLEGTPAQRAGVRAGDLIKKVDGLSTVGFTLDQAVEVITGPADTKVVLTLERKGEDDEPFELDVPVIRQRIDLPTVKGWEKVGAGDRDWNWFVDDTRGIGYVRLTGFTEHTTRDFDAAVRAMRAQGLNGLILDLRFNPGGLLDQAVSIAERFVDRGLIVRTEDGDHMTRSQEVSRGAPSDVSVGDIPVIVLINEGSASASEIVSGAIQAGAHKGRLQALLVGQRSFGKGSVQNVYPLARGEAAMKLTTQYYRIDSPRMIHKVPGATEWGIDPDLEVELLPDQITDALLLRREADVLPLDENGNIITNAERPDPDSLIDDGTDLQLQTALVLLQSQRLGNATSTAQMDSPRDR